MTTRQTVCNQILAYLNHQLSLAQLVDWAEDTINEAEFDPRDSDLLSEIIARIGAADAEDFNLSWEDLDGFLSRLGYKAKVMVA